jgi:hypothetical protein
MRRSTLVPSSFTGSTRAIVIAGAAVLVASGTAGAAWGMESRSAHVTPATVTSPVHSESASHSNTVTHAASAAPTVKQDDDTTGGETDAGESGVLPTAPDVTETNEGVGDAETNEGVGDAETTDGGAGSSVGREFPMTGGQHQGELQGLGTAGMMH